MLIGLPLFTCTCLVSVGLLVFGRCHFFLSFFKISSLSYLTHHRPKTAQLQCESTALCSTLGSVAFMHRKLLFCFRASVVSMCSSVCHSPLSFLSYITLCAYLCQPVWMIVRARSFFCVLTDSTKARFFNPQRCL